MPPTDREKFGIVIDVNNHGIHSDGMYAAKSQQNENKSPYQDSPYFDAFCKEEMNSFRLVMDIVKDIREKTEAFSKAGTAMADATRQLSSSCQFHLSVNYAEEKRDNSENRPKYDGDLEEKRARIHLELGSEVAMALESLGKALNGIASEQQNMCTLLEDALGSHIENMISDDMKAVKDLNDEVRCRTENAERLFFKYLNGKNAAGNLPRIASIVSAEHLDMNVGTGLMIKNINWRKKVPQDKNRINANTTNNIFFRNGNRTDLMDNSIMAAMRRQGLLRCSKATPDLLHSSSGVGEGGKGRVRRQGDKQQNPKTSQKKSTADMLSNLRILQEESSLRARVVIDPSEGDDDVSDGSDDDHLEGSSSYSVSSVDQSIHEVDENDIDKIIKEWKQIIENVRLAQGIAEFRRFQLHNLIIHSRCERTVKLSKCIETMCNGIQGYHIQCSKLLDKTMSTSNGNMKQSEEISQHHEVNIKPILRKKERAIVRKLVHLNDKSSRIKTPQERKTTNQSRPGHHLFDYSIIESSEKNKNWKKLCHRFSNILEISENKLAIWDTPTSLTPCLPFSIIPPKGVLLEGWLYRKNEASPTILQALSSPSDNSSWDKQWYLLKSDGMYCLKQSSYKSSTSGADDYMPSKPKSFTSKCHKRKDFTSIEFDHSVISKVCSITSCTIREMLNNPSERFCFELILPAFSMVRAGATRRQMDNESIMFQARGPKEFQLWVEAIRDVSTGKFQNESSSLSSRSFFDKISNLSENKYNDKQHHSLMNDTSSDV